MSSTRCRCRLSRQNSNVCCAESTLASQWWQRAVASFLIRCKYSPKHPCPVSQGGGAAPSNQTSQFGRTASRTLSPGAPALMSRLTRHLSQRRRPSARPRPTDPACGGKFRDTSVPKETNALANKPKIQIKYRK